MTSQFYKGEAMEEKAFMELLPKLYLINAVGKKTIDMLIRKDIVDKDTPKTIGGIPYVHVVFEKPKN